MALPKIIVRYLPQFHRTKENDMWWGNGFTEWTAVKNAKRLFQGHRQPRVPYDGFYYNLLQKNTLQWQANLAHQYCIDGFAFYHYWFKDSRKVLERPAENLLHWKDIDMPFCFSWANETWARTWSNLMQKNTWADVYEGGDFQEKEDSSGILLEQAYGEEKEWQEHIMYLLPFFLDKRYIKQGNSPVFMIYKPEDIDCLPDMLACWNKILHENGLDDVYIIGETKTGDLPLMPSLDAQVVRFPDYAMQQMKAEIDSSGVKMYDYNSYWEKLFAVDWAHIESKTYICAATDYDSTPRRGPAGLVLENVTVDCFKNNFIRLMKLCSSLNHEYVFLNAWNEWGEGMYLEPDKENGSEFLKAIHDVCQGLKYDKLDESVEYDANVPLGLVPNSPHRAYIESRGVRAMSRWLELREQNKSISTYLRSRGYYSIAIYGFGFMGKHLLTELQESRDISIAYIIDRSVDSVTRVCPTYRLSENLPPVDIIIVTPNGQYDAIKRDIAEKVKYPTVSLEHILFEC